MMRFICGAPEQTCNRLWTYITSVDMCVEEKKKMVFLFFDWTIEGISNRLHCPFIYFPLWHKWYLERRKGWNTRKESCYSRLTLPKLKRTFRPKEEIMNKVEGLIAGMKQMSDMVIGVYIRLGDYATWHNGRFFYEIEKYHLFENGKAIFDG